VRAGRGTEGAERGLARGLTAIARRLRLASARAQRSATEQCTTADTYIARSAAQRITRPVVACARLRGSRYPPGGSMRCGICAGVRVGVPVSGRRRLGWCRWDRFPGRSPGPPPGPSDGPKKRADGAALVVARWAGDVAAYEQLWRGRLRPS
jgi:hypothetical protein